MIWACTVTSSALVGSSAISSFGWQISAIAISARWHMPPLNWCGYCPKRACGSGMPTWPIMLSACARAVLALTARCARSASASWMPTG